ncbi:MAG: TonB-dependent receptor [Bacteroidetes bacterium]|nr:TonB-dependent receptor [Bacteroidota bacterium]
MFKVKIIIIALISSFLMKAQTVVLSGYLQDAASGEALIYANILVNNYGSGTSTNEYGYFSFEVPANQKLRIQFSHLGSQSLELEIRLSQDSIVNLKLEPSTSELSEVTVTAEQNNLVQQVQDTRMSTINVQLAQIQNIPSLGGEVDIIKAMQLLPGVSKGGEGSSGMFVRGGDADQNLVLLDEATVYNLGHLFGFFSVFNPDAINDLVMIKGAFPANYGGRLSAVLDVRMKEGNDQEFHGQGGVSLLSSRLMLEGPLVKDKASFLISGRRTYIDQVFGLVGISLPYYFYDLNAKVNWKISPKDRIFISSYFGDDVLNISTDSAGVEEEGDSASTAGFGLDFGFQLGNMTQTVRWNHIYNPKLFSNLSLTHTAFRYNIFGNFIGNSILIRSEIRDLGAKMDFTKYQSNNLTLKYGGQVINHSFRPNIISTQGEISQALSNSQGRLQSTLELAAYTDFAYDLSQRFRIQGGLRLSATAVKNRFFIGPEPRLSARYLINDESSFKMSYSRMYQYMHRVSSSSVALPTDLWYPVSEKVKPQSADQIALGFEKAFPDLKTLVSVEAYAKWMNNLIEYREGANLILNDNFEEQLLQGRGTAQGLELLVKRDAGRLTGWIGYTLSWARRDFDELNEGRSFWAKYDRRHYLSLVANYEFTKRFAFSAIWEYTTGARFTAQIGQYIVPNPSLTDIDIIPVYTDRNAVQMSPSHRLDLNFIIRGNRDKRFKSEWHLGGYNVYNRATPYRINVELMEDGSYQYSQPGLFGFIPSIAYNFKF